MRSIKYFLGIALSVAVFAGCKKESYNDTSFIKTVTAPAKLSVLFNITQDNTGLVTINLFQPNAPITLAPIMCGKLRPSTACSTP